MQMNLQNPLHDIKSIEKVWARVTSKGFKLVFFDMKFQIFVEFINFNSSISKYFCVSVPSKTLEK